MRFLPYPLEVPVRYTRDASACSVCGHPYLTRRRRSLWMKLLGIHKHLRCDACRSHLLYRARKSSPAAEVKP